MIKKEEILSEIINTFSDLNRAKVFLDFQFYLKGENSLLSYLNSIGGESTPGELAGVLNISGARVAAILRSIERKKLVERVTDSKDKRRVTVKITQKGKEWVSLAGSEIYQHALNVFDKLGEEDTKELVRIIKKMMRIENGEETSIEQTSDADSNEKTQELKNSNTENNINNNSSDENEQN